MLLEGFEPILSYSSDPYVPPPSNRKMKKYISIIDDMI